MPDEPPAPLRRQHQADHIVEHEEQIHQAQHHDPEDPEATRRLRQDAPGVDHGKEDRQADQWHVRASFPGFKVHPTMMAPRSWSTTATRSKESFTSLAIPARCPQASATVFGSHHPGDAVVISGVHALGKRLQRPRGGPMAAIDDLSELVERAAAAERLAVSSKWKERDGRRQAGRPGAQAARGAARRPGPRRRPDAVVLPLGVAPKGYLRPRVSRIRCRQGRTARLMSADPDSTGPTAQPGGRRRRPSAMPSRRWSLARIALTDAASGGTAGPAGPDRRRRGRTRMRRRSTGTCRCTGRIRSAGTARRWRTG